MVNCTLLTLHWKQAMSGKHKYRECLLFGASLSALGSTGVVSNEAPEAHGHCCVTVVHSHHSHLLSRGPMGNSQSPNVWLQKTNGTCHTVLHTHRVSMLGQSASQHTCHYPPKRTKIEDVNKTAEIRSSHNI